MTAQIDPVPLRTYAWAIETNGSLTSAQRRKVRAAVARSFVAIAEGMLGSLRRRPTAFAAPEAPDSRLARLAEEAAAEQGPALEGHGYRTWLVGAALADHDGVTVDPEHLYVASLLHDAGMLREVAGEDFTIRSAQAVLAVCDRDDAGNAETGRVLADAVVAHTTPGLDPRAEPLGFYVQAGAMADLAGLRLWDLPRGYLREAYAAHPGCGVHQVVPGLIRREADQVPEGRFAVLRHAGMHRMVQVSPTRRY